MEEGADADGVENRVSAGCEGGNEGKECLLVDRRAAQAHTFTATAELE